MLPKPEARGLARGSVKLWQLRKNKACLVLSLHLNQLVCRGLLASVPTYSVCDASSCSRVWSGKNMQLNALVLLLAEMCIRLQEFVGQMKSAINALCGL